MSDDQVRNVMGIPVDGALGAEAGYLLDRAIMDGSLFTGVTSEERLSRACTEGGGDALTDPGAVIMAFFIGIVIIGFFGFALGALYSVSTTPAVSVNYTDRSSAYSPGTPEYAMALTIARTYDADGNVTGEYTLRDQIPYNAVYDYNAYHSAQSILNTQKLLTELDAYGRAAEQLVPEGSRR